MFLRSSDSSTSTGSPDTFHPGPHAFARCRGAAPPADDTPKGGAIRREQLPFLFYACEVLRFLAGYIPQKAGALEFRRGRGDGGERETRLLRNIEE